MAIPTTITEETVYYIVEISGGSPFRGKSWDLDDYNRQMEYKHPKKVRNEIGAIRQRVNVAKDNTCMTFHKKIRFTNAAGKATLERVCAEADREMKLIDPTLHISPMFFEQTVTQLNTGNMFELMRQELNEQCNTRVLDRVEEYIEKSTVRNEQGEVISVKPITAQVRKTLLRAAEGVRSINILDDPTVNTRIDSIKALLETTDLTEIRDELLGYIDSIQEADNLEISPDQPGEGMKADADLDEDKYKPRPLNPDETAAIEINVEDFG
jgi:hypothetical protein